MDNTELVSNSEGFYYVSQFVFKQFKLFHPIVRVFRMSLEIGLLEDGRKYQFHSF